jgi:SAM-dependent methyltransferase
MPITKRSLRPPLAVGWALRRTRELVDPWLDQGGARIGEGAPADSGAGGARTGGAAASSGPPRRLRARAGAPGARAFQEGGRQAAGELAAVLAGAGREPAGLRSVLDFGCGAGRVLPHFAALAPAAECSGCDVDEEAIAWAGRSRPGAAWSLTSFHPPLPYEPESFDLIYSISVFSHLRRELAGLWLAELARVLSPGGMALLSVHGPHAFERFRRGEVTTSWCPRAVFERGPLRPDEFLFAPYARSFFNDGDLPGVGRDYGLAFQGPEHTRAGWSPSLQVVEVQERALTDWQDVVVCMKC